MGSSRRRSCRQHTAARQAAGHAALPEPCGLPATSEGAKGSSGRPREAPCPCHPIGTHSDPKQSRAAGIQAYPSHRVLERGRTARPLRRGGRSPGSQHRTQENPGRRGVRMGLGREARRGTEVRDKGAALRRGQPRFPAGTGSERALLQRCRPRLGARPSGRSTAAPPAAAVAACGAPSGAGTCVQAAHPGKHPSHLK